MIIMSGAVVKATSPTWDKLLPSLRKYREETVARKIREE